MDTVVLVTLWRWHFCDVGDRIIILVTFLMLVSFLMWLIDNQHLKSVTCISKLSPTHFVTNTFCHQHRCSLTKSQTKKLPDGSYISFKQDNWSLKLCSLSGPIFSFSQSFSCCIIGILAHAFKIQIFLVNNIFKLCHCSVLIVHMNFSLLELLISNTNSIFDSETLFLTIYNISETVSSRTFWLSIILSKNNLTKAPYFWFTLVQWIRIERVHWIWLTKSHHKNRFISHLGRTRVQNEIIF